MAAAGGERTGMPEMSKEQRIHSRLVAARLLELAGDDNFTQLQLQKLTYYANGWHIAFHGSPLTKDSVEAWKYGPVYPDLWAALRKHGKQELKRVHIDADTKCISKSQNDVIEAVFFAYGHLNGFKLSSMTHQKDSPWYKAFRRGERRKISPKLIGDHFDRLKREQRGK